MARPHDNRTAFRCSVVQENSAALLRVGGRLVKVNVLDTSRAGFTIRMPLKAANKLNDRKKYEFRFAGERWIVQKKSCFSESGESAHVGLARIRDLTKLDEVSCTWWPRVRLANIQADPAFLMFLMLAFLLMCVTLPGVGDKLGTAPKVRDGVHVVLDVLRDFIR